MIPPNWQELIWTTRDGREIPLAEMEPSHLANAIACLGKWRLDCRKTGRRSEARELSTTLTIFNKERKRRTKERTP